MEMGRKKRSWEAERGRNTKQKRETREGDEKRVEKQIGKTREIKGKGGGGGSRGRLGQ